MECVSIFNVIKIKTYFQRPLFPNSTRTFGFLSPSRLLNHLTQSCATVLSLAIGHHFLTISWSSSLFLPPYPFFSPFRAPSSFLHNHLSHRPAHPIPSSIPIFSPFAHHVPPHSYSSSHHTRIHSCLLDLWSSCKIREDSKKGVYVENVKEVEVTNAQDVIQQLIQKGSCY